MQDAPKTTLSTLLAAENTQAQALLTNSTDENIDFGDQPTTLTPPRVGDYWQGQGGYYAGIIRDGDRQWHLIDSGRFVPTAAWAQRDVFIPGEFSRRDGRHNTNLILAADPDNEIASHCTALLIEGHKDFYWPSQCENNLLFNNLPEVIGGGWHWSSTQISVLSASLHNFEDGDQGFLLKASSLLARAVRRVNIQ